MPMDIPRTGGISCRGGSSEGERFVSFASNDRGLATVVDENPIAGLAFVRDLRSTTPLKRARREFGNR